MASPDFRINGSAVGVPVYVAASAAISATLDSTDGVRQTLWYIESTDETTLPANYTLVQSGSVGQTVTTTALTAGTAAKLRCRINNGVNLGTGLNDPDGTEATGKFGVLSAGGYAVGCVNETTESDGVFGWAKILNPIIRIMPAAPIVSFSVVAPILNNGTATVPIFALDYAEAATASKVPIRGASGELNAVAFQASTSTFEHNRLAFDSAVTGTIINSAGPITTDSATSQIRKIGGVTAETLTATSLNIPTGSTFAVNGVGHATSATNSSLAFRGTAGELSVARLYNTGTVHTTAWLSYSRNGIILGCKTGGGVDHSVITEDGSAGFVYGDATSTTKHTFKADSIDALVLNPGGITTMGTSASGSIEFAANSGEVITFDVGGDSYSFDEMGFSIPAGNTLQVGGVSMTSSATNSAPMIRDASGRTQVSDPSVDADVATKGYVDGADRNSATEPTVIVASDRYVYVDGTVVNNITLPTATTFNGINLTLINTSDSIGDDITITSNGGQIIGIGGSAAIVLGFGFTMTLRGRASDWVIISTGTV